MRGAKLSKVSLRSAGREYRQPPGQGMPFWPRVAVDHVVVVVVARAIGAQRRRPATSDSRSASRARASRRRCPNPRCSRSASPRGGWRSRRRAVGGGPGLELRELGVRGLRVDREPRLERVGEEVHRERAAQHVAGLRVVLERLADQEVLDEIHARAAVDAGQLEAAVAREAVVALEMRRDSRARGVAESLGIRIAAARGLRRDSCCSPG